jgi:hypothetical protein
MDVQTIADILTELRVIKAALHRAEQSDASHRKRHMHTALSRLDMLETAVKAMEETHA